MSNVTQIRQDQAGDDSPDPLRAALASAIEAEREARAAVSTANENLRRGHEVVEASQTALEGARNRVSKARERDSRATAAAVRNKSSAAPDATSTRSARAAVQDHEDNLEVAQGAISRLEQDVAESKAAVEWAVVDRMAAANAALAPICSALLEQARAARRDLAIGKALLTELLSNPSRGAPEFRDDALGGMRAREQITAPLSGLRAEVEGLMMLNPPDEERAAVEAAVAGMRSFLARLATDATA